jgi:hypothetical protein
MIDTSHSLEPTSHPATTACRAKAHGARLLGATRRVKRVAARKHIDGRTQRFGQSHATRAARGAGQVQRHPPMRRALFKTAW